MLEIDENKLCSNCKWRKQYPECLRCSHQKKIMYIKIKVKCHICDRDPKQNKNGCGYCNGRGKYISPSHYNDSYNKCDCGGFEKK